jgi:ArsR family transcriptional regulator, arsenate/arsenite/antimonite-responsive transcriptional repressor
MNISELAIISKALGDETRLRIFDMLRDGPLCACKILEQLHITQPTLSHHMRILCGSGIVVPKKDWKWTYYSIDCKVLNEYLGFISDISCRRQPTL